MAEDSFERGGSPLYARLAREHADDPVLAEIAGGHEPRWEVPLRLFGGVHLLALTGEEPDPWSRFGGGAARPPRVARREFVATEPVQTNEVQRCWALLPAFLTVADGRPLDLVELGPSAGLNLLWDRYGYRYPDATWGPADARARARRARRARRPSPASSSTEVTIGERLGIDQAPVDLADEQQALRLQCFVWADQTERLERLRRAIEIARADPPELLAGDYVERLPGVLAKRAPRGAHGRLPLGLDGLPAARATARRLEETIEDAAARAARLGLLRVLRRRGRSRSRRSRRFRARGAMARASGRRLLAYTDGHGNRMRWVA